MPADVRPASFVAQNPAQRRRVAHDAHAVVVAGVRSRAEDAGDARTAAQQRAGRPHEVGFDGDACRGEITRQRLPQAGALFGVAFAAAGAVEMERVGLHRFREGLAEQRLHFVGALEHGVDATALYAAYAAAVVDELPVAFGRSAVCDYDHRFGREFTGFRFLCGARFSGGSARAGRKYSNKCRKKSRIIVGLFARACCIGLLRLRRHGGHFDGCGGCGKTRGRPRAAGPGWFRNVRRTESEAGIGSGSLCRGCSGGRRLQKKRRGSISAASSQPN